MIMDFLRHGIAVDIGECGVKTDSERMLSKKGRQRTEESARGLKVAGCLPARIVSSPLLRAVETAEIVADVLGRAGEVEIDGIMSSGLDPDDFLDWLKGQPDVDTMFVGHMPDLAEVCSYIVSGRKDMDIVFGKAAICRIGFGPQVDAGYGRLQWLIQPKLLRQLAGS